MVLSMHLQWSPDQNPPAAIQHYRKEFVKMPKEMYQSQSQWKAFQVTLDREVSGKHTEHVEESAMQSLIVHPQCNTSPNHDKLWLYLTVWSHGQFGFSWGNYMCMYRTLSKIIQFECLMSHFEAEGESFKPYQHCLRRLLKYIPCLALCYNLFPFSV